MMYTVDSLLRVPRFGSHKKSWREKKKLLPNKLYILFIPVQTLTGCMWSPWKLMSLQLEIPSDNPSVSNLLLKNLSENHWNIEHHIWANYYKSWNWFLLVHFMEGFPNPILKKRHLERGPQLTGVGRYNLPRNLQLWGCWDLMAPKPAEITMGTRTSMATWSFDIRVPSPPPKKNWAAL